MKTQKRKKYVRVTARNFNNKADRQSAKALERFYNWYIEDHIEDIRKSAMEAYFNGDFEERIRWTKTNIGGV